MGLSNNLMLFILLSHALCKITGLGHAEAISTDRIGAVSLDWNASLKILQSCHERREMTPIKALARVHKHLLRRGPVLLRISADVLGVNANCGGLVVCLLSLIFP